MNGEKIMDWIFTIVMVEVFILGNIALIILFLDLLGVI